MNLVAKYDGHKESGNIRIEEVEKILQQLSTMKLKDLNKHNDVITEKYLGDICNIRKFSVFSKPRKIKGPHIEPQDLDAVSPRKGIEEVKASSRGNCELAAIAYDMRRRGYDVAAKLCGYAMPKEKVLEKIYFGKIDFKRTEAKTWYGLLAELTQDYPAGSRGYISLMQDKHDIGHGIIFERQKDYIAFMDAQSGSISSIAGLMKSEYNPSKTRHVRLDDKKVKWNNVDIACAELKENWKEHV